MEGNKVPRKKKPSTVLKNQRVSAPDFIKVVGKENIEALIRDMMASALRGHRKDREFILKYVHMIDMVRAYAKIRYPHKIKTQKDIDTAMTEVLARAMAGDDHSQISLQEAETLSNLILKKKETMDECLYMDVLEMQKKVGMIK